MADSSSPQSDQEVLDKHELKEPRRFKVLMHNDDYSTMEFVIEVLRNVFNKNESEAVTIMMNIHQKGMGICGIFTLEIAETKVGTVHKIAKARGYPLRCTMEEV